MYSTFSSPKKNSGSDLVTHAWVVLNTITLVLLMLIDKPLSIQKRDREMDRMSPMEKCVQETNALVESHLDNSDHIESCLTKAKFSESSDIKPLLVEHVIDQGANFSLENLDTSLRRINASSQSPKALVKVKFNFRLVPLFSVALQHDQVYISHVSKPKVVHSSMMKFILPIPQNPRLYSGVFKKKTVTTYQNVADLKEFPINLQEGVALLWDSFTLRQDG